MEESVTLCAERDASNALTEMTVSTGLGDTIVFNEGTYYPPLPHSPSRGYDEYVVVRTENLPLLAGRLGVEGAPIREIFAAVVALAQARAVKRLYDARQLLDSLGVPYSQDTWIDRD